MLEPPQIDQSLLRHRLLSEYSLKVSALEFLPLGADVNTAVFRVLDQNGATYFLKLRKGYFAEITVALPEWLSQQGIRAVIPPLRTRAGALFSDFPPYKIILYPFIEGRDAYQAQLTEKQWIEFGVVLRRIHGSNLPAELLAAIPEETFSARWREEVRRFQRLVEERVFEEPVSAKVAALMKEKHVTITHLVNRAEELAISLRAERLPFVVCHSDLHPGNLLLGENDSLHLVDWDNPILAPRERDLMFVGGGMFADQPDGREETSFYQGYGEVEVHRDALAYYRYERVIEDIAAFGEQLLLSDDGGKDREQAFEWLSSSFHPGHDADMAMRTDPSTK